MVKRMQANTDLLGWLLSSSARKLSSSEGRTLFIF
jgi:integrase